MPGAKASLAEVLTKARTDINVAEIGIGPGDLRPKRTITGGLIIEVAGEDQIKKAEALASAMRATLAQYTEVKVAVPKKLAELRLSRIDESVTRTELETAVARVGGCDSGEVRLGGIKFPPHGLGTVWVRCPVAAAKKVVAAKTIPVGWSAVVATPLEARPLQCFRCLAFGHVRARCPAAEERGTRCFGCGGLDHLKAQCTETKVSCFLCRERGHEASHRLGGPRCKALEESRRRRPPEKKKPDAAPKKKGDGPFKKPVGVAPKTKKKADSAGAPSLSGETSMEVEA